MGRLLKEPGAVFQESCCDGGAVCNDLSAQPCGCDKGANHKCELHRGWVESQEGGIRTFTEVPSAPNRGTINRAVESTLGPTRTTILPEDAAGRKSHPVASGVLDYFPDALVAISNVSWRGNEQHNPGQPLHWAREKSTDEADTMIRHFLQRGSLDTDGSRHSAKMAWRALALLQKEIENER